LYFIFGQHLELFKAQWPVFVPPTSGIFAHVIYVLGRFREIKTCYISKIYYLVVGKVGDPETFFSGKMHVYFYVLAVLEFCYSCQTVGTDRVFRNVGI